jgi:hypothetical protein
MEKVKITYPISSQFSEAQGTRQLVIKSVFASLCGASIPAVIFYFLM